MIIEENPIEKQAMKAFHEGFREEGLKLQEKFVSAFRREYAEKDQEQAVETLWHHKGYGNKSALHPPYSNLPVLFLHMFLVIYL